MISVSVQGASGKLGSKIVEYLADFSEFKYVGPVEKGGNPPICDVLVAVAGAEGTADLIRNLSGQRLLVGSTGELPMKALEEYSKTAAVMLVPNFSTGMGLLYEFINFLDREKVSDFTINISDVHHVHKKDSPSGTALRMEALLKERGIEADIKSERSGEVIGNHTLILENSYERLEISHEVLSRDVYAQGCLKFIKELNTLGTGLYSK